MMIQLKGSAQFNEVDACLMSVVSRVIAGSLYKLRAERNAVEQMERSKYIIETCMIINNELYSPSPSTGEKYCNNATEDLDDLP